MGTTTALFVNNFDTSRLGFILESALGWPDGLGVNLRTVPIPGRDGELVLPPESPTLPRTIDIHGVIKDVSVAALRVDVDALKDRLYSGTIEARFVDRADRFAIARCRQFRTPPIGPQFANKGVAVDFTLLCPDPAVYDTQPTVVGFSTSRAQLPLGNALVRPLIRIMGAVNNPVLTLRDFRGVTRQTMTFTVNLAATDYLEIDCDLGTVTKYASGASSNGITLLTAGDFMVCDPSFASFGDSLWPTLEVSGGSGDATFRRAWI